MNMHGRGVANVFICGKGPSNHVRTRKHEITVDAKGCFCILRVPSCASLQVGHVLDW
jgi:hypothetical protein